jgi:hypothetical protein
MLQTAAILVLAIGTNACAGSSSGIAGAPAAVPLNPSAASPVGLLVGGEYTGNVKDSAYGKGTIVIQFSQSGTTIGGSLKSKYGAKTVPAVAALTLSQTALGGNSVALLASPCTFSFNATYNAKTHVLAGRYDAIDRCSNQSGTFRAKEKCYYVTATALSQTGNQSDRPNTFRLNPC